MNAIKTRQDASRERIHECIEAIRAQFYGAVRPIYGSTDRRLAMHIGSCMLLDLGGTRLVLTAAHVIDHGRVTSLYIAGGRELVALEADFLATTPPGDDRKEDRHDFAIAKLSPATVTELGNVRYISDREILPRGVPTEGHLYVALGYPNSKNKQIDHLNKMVPDAVWSYGDIAVERPKLKKYLNVTGDDHLFVGFDRKRSRDAKGAVVNSIEPIGVSGGALVDAGNLADPANLAPDAPCRGMLVGMLIEHHASHKAIVAIRVDSILRAMSRRKWL